MKNINIFRNLYGIPLIVQNQLDLAVNSLEHPIYHPERYLDKHIDIVVGRALETSIKELHFAAILHDITKSGYCPPLWVGRYGKLRPTEKGDYWRNDEHQYQAVDFIRLPEVTQWMLDNSIDIQMVCDICENHMFMKEHLYGRWSCGNVITRDFFKAFDIPYTLKTLESIRVEYDYWDLAYFFSSYCDNMRV